MRVALDTLFVASTALLLITSTDAAQNCGECAGKTCILANTADVMAMGQSWMNVRFCNFDKAKVNDYKLEFSLKFPLACDAKGETLPILKSLQPEEPCAPDNCVVRVNFDAVLDWAIALKNGAETNLLSARLTSPAGVVQDTVVPIALATATPTAAVTGPGPAVSTPSTVCSTQFPITASRLSRAKACNVVQLCMSKPTETNCAAPPPATAGVFIDDVNCDKEACTGTITLPDALPCGSIAADTNALLASVKVGNSAPSAYARIATLEPVAKVVITDVDEADVGSSTLVVKTNAVCPPSALQIKVSDLSVASFTATNGSLLVALSKELTSSQSGKSVDVTVSQCGVASAAYKAEIDGDAAPGDDSSDASGGSSATDTVGKTSAPGTQSTQQDKLRTGLSGGLYIGIGVGAIAFFGFIFECVYHKRRHPKQFADPTTGRGYGQTAV